MPHKFAVGDSVLFHPAGGRTIDAALGLYLVTKRLPAPGGKLHYRIKHPKRTTRAHRNRKRAEPVVKGMPK